MDHTEKPPSLIDTVLKLGPWVYGALVLIGFLRLHSYYHVFGIEIWTYLSTGELLLSFLNITGSMTAMIIVLGVMMWASVQRESRSDTDAIDLLGKWMMSQFTKLARVWGDPSLTLLKKGILVVAFFTLGMLLPLAVALAIAGPICVVLGMYDEQPIPPALLWEMGVVLAMMFTFLMYVDLMRQRFNPWQYIFLTVSLSLALLVFTNFSRRIAREEMIGNRTVQGVTIATSDLYYATNTNLIYLGKCNASVFLYNRSDSTAIVVPTDDIKWMKFHRLSPRID